MFTTDDVVVAKEIYHLFYLILQIEARRGHIVNQQRGDIVERCRENQLISLRNIANHKEDIGYTYRQFRVSIGTGNADSIIHSLLSTGLQTLLEHIVVKFIKRNELTYFGLSIVGSLSRSVNHLDDASFVTFHLLSHIPQSKERVEHLHDELKLIRNKGVEVDKVSLRIVALIRIW